MKKVITIPQTYTEAEINTAVRLVGALVKTGRIKRTQGLPEFTIEGVSYEVNVSDTDTANVLVILEEAHLLLCSDEMPTRVAKDAADAHIARRFGFCVQDGLVFFPPDGWEHVSTYDWLRYARLWSADTIERTIRGNMTKDRIALYCGSEYNKIDMNGLSVSALRALWYLHYDKFHEDSVEIVNGVIPGEIGTEWEARESFGKLNYDTFYQLALQGGTE